MFMDAKHSMQGTAYQASVVVALTENSNKSVQNSLADSESLLLSAAEDCAECCCAHQVMQLTFVLWICAADQHSSALVCRQSAAQYMITAIISSDTSVGRATYPLAFMPGVSIIAIPARHCRHLFSPCFTLGPNTTSGFRILAGTMAYTACCSSMLLHLGSACRQNDMLLQYLSLGTLLQYTALACYCDHNIAEGRGKVCNVAGSKQYISAPLVLYLCSSQHCSCITDATC